MIPGDDGPAGGIAPSTVILVGYMCSGKSVVGEALGRRLEWPLIDFDAEIERREGRSINRIVEAEGEAYLRSLEAALTDEIQNEDRLVIAPGGGWITQPELLERLRGDALVVWLRVTPSEAVRRLKSDPRVRPFRNHPDPVEEVAAMMREREPLYRLADMALPTNGRSVEEIAFEIEQLYRTRAR